MKAPAESVKPVADEIPAAIDLGDGVAAAQAPDPIPEEEAADISAFDFPVESEGIRPPPMTASVDDEPSPPPSLDTPDSIPPAAPRSKRLQIIVGAVVGACALVGILAMALGDSKGPTGPTHPETTTTTAATVAAPAAPTATAEVPTATAAEAVAPPPTASADVAPPPTAEPTAEPVVAPPVTPKVRVPTYKPPTKPTKPVIKKYDPKGI